MRPAQARTSTEDARRRNGRAHAAAADARAYRDKVASATTRRQEEHVALRVQVGSAATVAKACGACALSCCVRGTRYSSSCFGTFACVKSILFLLVRPAL